MDVQTPDNNTHSLHTIYIKTLLAVSRTKTEGCQTRIGITENAGYARNGLAHKEQFAVKFVRMRGKKKKKTLREFIKAKAGNSEKKYIFITSTAKNSQVPRGIACRLLRGFKI